MIGNWESFGSGDAKRFLEFARAYLQASEDVCVRIANNEPEKTWANASVSLMLAAHSVELFLKGMLLARNVRNSWGHSIEDLYETYRANYPNAQFSFNCPFLVEYLGMSADEIREARKNSKGQASVVFRYPVNKPSVEWEGCHGFTPDGFLKELRELRADFTRLERLVGL